MLANFKKFGVAAAVAAALGASGAVQAVTLGEPGNALLVPHVIYDSKNSINTLIGVVVASRVSQDYLMWSGHTAPSGIIGLGDCEQGGCGTTTNTDDLPPWNTQGRNFSTLSPLYSYYGGPYYDYYICSDYYFNSSYLRKLHWYFFDVQSVHRADGAIEISCEDFVRIDWSKLVKETYKSMDGKLGYMVISDENARFGTGTGVWPMYGAAYLIAGNWASEAFIPVYPLLDLTDATKGGYWSDEVRYLNSVPVQVNPLRSGISLPNITTANSDVVEFSLRYFLGDSSLPGSTAFVLWFPENNTSSYYAVPPGRVDLPIDVYDADEVAISTSISVPYELNVIDASKIDGTTNDPTGHLIPDPAYGVPKNTGYVVFNIADGQRTSSAYAAAVNGQFGYPTSSLHSSLSTAPVPRAGVAFSLVGISGANTLQVQTELAHERGIAPYAYYFLSNGQ